jgi:hypothetical protein
MPLMSWRGILSVLAAWAAVTGCAAGEVLTFDSCTDAAGQAVGTEADDAQPVLVRTSYDAGRPIIRYNPTLLPGLPPVVRQFFYAHECARHALGDAGDPAPSVARARRADCVGLAALLASGLLTRDRIADLQAKLNVSDDAWPLLPGPRRAFNLAACRTGGVLRLPAPASPTAGQSGWNACIRGCADRSWTCQNACRGETCASACQDSHKACEAACGLAPDRQRQQP